jgi:hypothetical protein
MATAGARPCTQTHESPPDDPVIAVDIGPPAFVITCWNNSTTDLQPGTTSHIRLWLDGSPNDPKGRGSSGPERPMISPGASWREIFTLMPEGSGPYGPYTPGGYGGVVQIVEQSVKLTPGSHSVSFECGGAKSDEISFYWKSAR